MKYTVIWQSATHPARAWIDEVFGPYIERHLYDGKREVVMDNAILVDDFVYIQPLEYYARFRGKNAYLAHFQDEFYEIGLDVYRNFRGVFRAFWADVFNPKYLMPLPVGYTTETRNKENAAVLAASQRRYLWSFMGGASLSSRPDMAREFARIEPHYFFPTDRVQGVVAQEIADNARRRLSREECAEILRNSTFAPAPMGNASTECYRPYEALESGAIPIVEKRLTLDYYRELLGEHPLPTVRSWAQARRLVTDLLQSPGKLDQLQAECMAWWADFKRNYSLRVGEFIEERNRDTAPLGELVTPWGQTALWKWVELSRHHDHRAGMRRAVRQFTRLIASGKLRVAHRAVNPR